MKTIVIGIMPKEKIRKRMLDIAKGNYKPKRSEPKVWFTSIKSVSEVLSEKNQELIHLIAANQPQSLDELAKASGRHLSNLSRTLKTLEGYGFVELKKQNRHVVPVAKATKFQINIEAA